MAVNRCRRNRSRAGVQGQQDPGVAIPFPSTREGEGVCLSSNKPEPSIRSLKDGSSIGTVINAYPDSQFIDSHGTDVRDFFRTIFQPKVLLDWTDDAMVGKVNIKKTRRKIVTVWLHG